MDPSLQSHFTDLIAKAKRIAIFPRPDSRGEAVAAAFGLGLYLEAFNKDVTVVAAVPERLGFMARPKQVAPALASNSDEFVIRLDTGQKAVAELRYEKTDLGLDIFIRAKDGRFEPADLTFPPARAAADLVITVGLADLDQLGETFSRDPDLFFSHPIVNIDAGPANELYGELNIVNSHAHAVAETIVELLETGDKLPPALSADAATALFASLVIATRNFQVSHLHAETMAAAAMLVSAGADRTRVLLNLAARRTVPQLQLAGRILARATEHGEGTYVSLLQPHDLTKTGVAESDLPEAVNELVSNFGQLRQLAVLWPEGNAVKALVATENRAGHDALAEEGASRIDEETSQLTLEGVGLKEAEERIVAALNKAHPQNG
ncbi:hypothetical protein HYW67_00930 [Candidatus Parcubacteria bacterium]|nr:hypothetical protein [Candidatus Parcubacteria bacterium]